MGWLRSLLRLLSLNIGNNFSNIFYVIKNIFKRFKLLRGIVTIWHPRHAEKKVNLLGFIVLSTAIVLYGNEGSGQSDVDKETVS